VIPTVRVEAADAVGKNVRITDVESGADLSGRVSAVDIHTSCREVTRVTLHTIGSLDVVGWVDQVVVRRAPWWHYVIAGFGAAALVELIVWLL
jgi:hypothetical protein